MSQDETLERYLNSEMASEEALAYEAAHPDPEWLNQVREEFEAAPDSIQAAEILRVKSRLEHLEQELTVADKRKQRFLIYGVSALAVAATIAFVMYLGVFSAKPDYRQLADNNYLPLEIDNKRGAESTAWDTIALAFADSNMVLASNSLTALLEAGNDSARASLALAHVHWQANQYEQAIEAAEHTTSGKTILRYKAEYLVGLCLLQLGKPNQAIPHLEAAVPFGNELGDRAALLVQELQ